MDRRQFLTAAGAAGVAAIMNGSAAAAIKTRDGGVRKPFYVDSQGVASGFDILPNGKGRANSALAAAIRQRRAGLISMTVGDVGNGPKRFESASRNIAEWNTVIRDNSDLIMNITRGSDIDLARTSGKLGLIYNFQDSTAFEANPDHVSTFAALGVKIMQLTYNKRNIAGDGCLERANAGLSDYGRELIARINKENVLLDLSHAGARTIAEGIEESKRPLTISHSGCRALVDFPRNTHDSEMRALADKGGVFGVYLMPFLRKSGQAQKEDLLRHLSHAVNVCGEDHVGIGTDGPLLGITIDDKARQDQREFYERRAKLGIAAPGEAPDVFNIVEGYNSADRYDLIAADLKAMGWNAARIEKVLGDNFIRLFEEVWGA